MPNDPNFDATRHDFIEKIGLISQAEGLPRIAGRVFGMLVFDGDIVSFGDLATQLQVSRASISTSIRLLEERGLIKRTTKAGERQDFFQLAQNPYVTLLEGVQKRNRASQNEIIDTIRKLPANAAAISRLNAYAEFYASTDAAVGMALREIKHPKDDRSGQRPDASKDQSHDR